MVKNLPAKQEMRVQSLGWEDVLEKEMARHSSILAWNPMVRASLVGYSPWGCKRAGHNWVTKPQFVTDGDTRPALSLVLICLL